MNIEDFCVIDDIELARRRLKFEEQIKQSTDLARKRFFARKTHKNLTLYLNSIKKKKLLISK